MKKAIVAISIVLVMLLVLSSCAEDNDVVGPPKDDPGLDKETLSGNLELPEESSIGYNGLEAVTFAGSSNIDGAGDFSVAAPKAESFQIIFFVSKQTRNPIFLGLYNPLTVNVESTVSTTAMALALINPMLIYSNVAQRAEYLDAVREHARFPDLMQILYAAYENDAESALDYEANPVMYQLLIQIIRDSMESLGDNYRNDFGQFPAPEIVDGAGTNIVFRNPRHIWYAAGVHPDGGSQSDVVTVNRASAAMSFNWAFPPEIEISAPAETEYDLGNGAFEILLTRGFDFSKIHQWNDPAGRATLLNTGQSMLYLIELFVGKLPSSNLSSLTHYIEVSSHRATEINVGLDQGNSQGLLAAFCGLVADNSQGLVDWIWQESMTNASQEYIKTSANLISKLAIALRLLGLSDQQSHFFLDLLYSPQEVTYFIQQSAGELTDPTSNYPPNAQFSMTPPAGIVGTEFMFDASLTTDDNDSIEELSFRWDWTSNGVWDTEWILGNPVAYNTYQDPGAYQVTLEVRDRGMLTNRISRTLNIGGGAGSANRVKLFRDNLPWNTNAMVNMLEELGFTEGLGEMTYEIISSDRFATVPLNPGDDLIIISNDQNQGFYNNYSASQIRFTNFVHNGGSMFWEACDRGWADGSIEQAGITLPGNVNIIHNYDRLNYVADQNLPLVAGLPDEMEHNYASHESFTNLPDGTTVYCVDSNNEATLIEFNIGLGWILMTGQPLEHQYINSSVGMEELLPRIVAHFTGQTFDDSLKRRVPPLEPLRSSGSYQQVSGMK